MTDHDGDKEVSFRHLLLCDSVQHDPSAPGHSYSVNGLINWLMPEDEYGYPLVVERIVIFAQVWGTRAEHSLTIDLIRIEENDDVRIATYGPMTFPVYGNEFVENRKWTLHQVGFPIPGLYEFRLFVDGQVEAALSERLFLHTGD